MKKATFFIHLAGNPDGGYEFSYFVKSKAAATRYAKAQTERLTDRPVCLVSIEDAKPGDRISEFNTIV